MRRKATVHGTVILNGANDPQPVSAETVSEQDSDGETRCRLCTWSRTCGECRKWRQQIVNTWLGPR